jgi:hypothetical protein
MGSTIAFGGFARTVDQKLLFFMSPYPSSIAGPCPGPASFRNVAQSVQNFADHIIAERGVRHGHVVYLPANGHTHNSRRTRTHPSSKHGR